MNTFVLNENHNGSSCMICGKSTDSRDRRILHSSSPIHVLPVLKRFMYDAVERELVDRKHIQKCPIHWRTFIKKFQIEFYNILAYSGIFFSLHCKNLSFRFLWIMKLKSRYVF